MEVKLGPSELRNLCMEADTNPQILKTEDDKESSSRVYNMRNNSEWILKVKTQCERKRCDFEVLTAYGLV